MNKKFIAVLICFFTLMGTTAVMAQCKQGPGPDGKRGPGPCMDRPPEEMMFGDRAFAKSKLGLTDEQLTKIAKINESYRGKMEPLFIKVRTEHDALREILMSKSVDREAVKVKVKQISEIKAELHLLKIYHRLDIEEVLTDKQKGLIRKHMKERMDKDSRGCPPEEMPD